MKNKTYANNFDTSSTGTNIEVSACYDTFLSQIYFNENFESLTEKRNISIYFYNDCNQIKKPDFELEIIGDIKDKRKYFYQFIDSNEENYTNEEIETALKDNKPTDYYEMQQYINELASYNITAKFKENLQEIKIRGYSQGDYAIVVYNPDKIKELRGKDPIESELKKMFSHYFFDSPIQAVATINGEEFYYEYDSYYFERDKFIEYVKKETGVDISEFLPEELPYND